MPRTHVVVEGENLGTLAAEFPTIKRLVGHRDIKADTECPGGELYKLLPDIRKGTGLKA